MPIEKRKSKSSFARLVAIVVANFIVLLFLLGLLEGYCRFAGIPFKVGWIPIENAIARFDQELGWSYIPNYSRMQELRGSTIPVHFDKHGIRVPYSGFQLDTSRPSVLFIGGSFTMGHGLSYEESFVGKFGSLDEVSYQVVNLGVQAYGSDQSLLALKRFLPKFNTKIVVYTFIEPHILRNGNYDRRMLYQEGKFLGTKPMFALNSKKELYLAKKPLRYENYIHSWLIDTLKLKYGRRFNLFPPYPEELTKAIILEMKKYSESKGVHFIVINWRWTTNGYNKLFNNLDVDVIDVLEEAPDDWERMITQDKHPNANASDHISQLLLNYISNKGWL